MTPLLLSLTTFLAFWLIGLALLALVGAKTSELWVALSAPVLGTVPTVILLFALSHAGFPMNDVAVPATIALLVVSAAIVILLRPSIPLAVVPVVVVCLINLLLVGRPLFQFGFDWISNANDDMANYVLSATQLLRHGLVAPFDIVGLSRDRDYASALQELHNLGARPGADITLSGFAKVTGRPPYEVFMPLILAFNLCTISGTAALAMRASRRWWTAVVAAALIAAAPLFAFGVLQQLMPQVFGLALAAVLVAWLMRAELHQSPGPRVSDLVIIGALTVTLIVVYVELASALMVAYGLFVALLVARRQITLRAVTLLWGTAVAAALVILNSYLLREVHFVAGQTAVGASKVAGSDFGYTLVPSALPAILGLQVQPPAPTAAYLAISVLIAIIILTGIIAASFVMARRSIAASIVVMGDLLIGLYLGGSRADFGLFKLYMFVQPFFAAVIAIWVTSATRRSVLAVGAAFLAILVGVQLYTEGRYVRRSSNPIDLPHASASDLLPTFRRTFAKASVPVIAVTENPTLAKLEAASTGNRPLYFVSSPIFKNLLTYDRRDGKTAARFTLLDSWKQLRLLVPRAEKATISVNTHASRILRKNRCLLALPTGSQLPLNRRLLPEGSPNLVFPACGDVRNVLIFTTSSLAHGFYGGGDRRKVSYYQLEHDPLSPGRTLVGFGRYAVFRIVHPSVIVRLELELTKTLLRGSNLLPPATVVGDRRVRLPLLGRGSAHVFSPPLRPQMIGGAPYVMLDMGEQAVQSVTPRPGLLGLYGRDLVLDPRYLTSYVRNISLVSDSQYDQLRAPSALRRFPEDLANPNLEYSGLYEDGWVAENSYVMLAGGPATDFRLDAAVLPSQGAVHLDVLVNGHSVASRSVKAGPLAWRIPVPAFSGRRRVELRWAGSVALRPPDTRRAAAQLRYLGFVPAAAAPTSVANFPADLAKPGLNSAGIYKDGWLKKNSHAMLEGGPAADLIVRADVPPWKGQRLDVLVNRRAVWSQSVKAGLLDLRISIPASPSPRRIDLRWAGTARIAANDPRQAAALLKSVGLGASSATRSALGHFPADLADPGLSYAGIYTDGWLAQDSYAILSGGPASTLTVRAEVPPRKGQHLDVRVNGHLVASRNVPPGPLELQAPLPAAKTSRRIELHWAGTIPLRAPDTRHAAALLEYLGVSRKPAH